MVSLRWWVNGVREQETQTQTRVYSLSFRKSTSKFGGERTSSRTHGNQATEKSTHFYPAPRPKINSRIIMSKCKRLNNNVSKRKHRNIFFYILEHQIKNWCPVLASAQVNYHSHVFLANSIWYRCLEYKLIKH